MSQVVLSWRDGPVAHIRLNKPATFNAVDPVLAAGFVEACRALRDDVQVRAVVLSAQGRAFMAGGDLPSLQAGPQKVVRDVLSPMHEALDILGQLPVPVIASVHGRVVGGGLGVALACDLCIAAEGSKFDFGYQAIGASADCGTTWSLTRIVGLRRAMEIALISGPMDAAHALALGLVNRVVPMDRLEAETSLLAQKLAGRAPLAVASIKRLMRDAAAHTWAAHLQAEAEAFERCACSHDFTEGVAAAMARRSPRFIGA